MQKALATILGIGVLFGGAACGGDKGGPGTDGSGKTGSTTGTMSGAASSGGGLADPSNDKAVVTLAEAALKCEWQDKSGLKSDCAGMTEWNKADAVKGGKADKTFTNFLGDAKKEVRWLGAYSLSTFASTSRSDGPMAKALVASAAREKDEAILKALGNAVGRLDVAKTGTADEVKKLLADGVPSLLRQGIVGGILFNNRTEGGFYDVLAGLARTEKDKEVRKAAAAAFWVGGSDRKDDTCKLWLELAADADPDLAGHSTYHCAFWSAKEGCGGQWDALLDIVEKRAKDGKLTEGMAVSALGYLYGQAKASDAQKKRCLDIAKATVENKTNTGMARGGALRVIGEHDTDAKAFAGKYEGDSEFFVKSTAKDIQDGKITVKK